MAISVRTPSGSILHVLVHFFTFAIAVSYRYHYELKFSYATTAAKISFSFLTWLRPQRTPGKFSYIWHFNEVGIIVTNCERARIQFDIHFLPVPPLLLKFPIIFVWWLKVLFLPRVLVLYYFLLCFNRVGRITGRLPQELADQIVENVLELFR